MNSTSTTKDKRDTLRMVEGAETWPPLGLQPSHGDPTIQRDPKHLRHCLKE